MGLWNWLLSKFKKKRFIPGLVPRMIGPGLEVWLNESLKDGVPLFALEDGEHHLVGTLHMQGETAFIESVPIDMMPPKFRENMMAFRRAVYEALDNRVPYCQVPPQRSSIPNPSQN